MGNSFDILLLIIDLLVLGILSLGTFARAVFGLAMGGSLSWVTGFLTFSPELYAFLIIISFNLQKSKKIFYILNLVPFGLIPLYLLVGSLVSGYWGR